MPIALTTDRLYGNSEASYTCTERVEIVRKGARLAVLWYCDDRCEGVHDNAGAFIGGEIADWSVVDDASDPAVARMIADWTADGWLLCAEAA